MNFRGIDPNFFGDSSLLLIAAQTRNFALLKKVLEIPGANPNLYDSLGNTAIIYCCESPDYDGVRILAEFPGAQINWQNRDGYSAFVVAAETDNRHILNFLIECPDFNADLSNASLALILAIQHDHISVCEIILSLNFDIHKNVATTEPSDPQNPLGKKRRHTPLKAAVFFNRQTVVASILKHPRFTNSRTDLRGSLFCAVGAQDLSLLQLLLPYLNNDINIHNKKNESLLTFACLVGCHEIVEFIIKHPLFNPVQSQAVKAMAATLRAPSCQLLTVLARTPGFDINATLPRDVNGTRAMRKPSRGESANQYGGHRLVEVGSGVTLLIAALRMNRADAVQTLLGIEGIDPSIKDENGRSALFDTAVRFPSEIPNLLGYPGMDVNERDNVGNTALIYAVGSRASGAVSPLVIEGIDIGARNHKGQNAWELAHFMRKAQLVDCPPMPEDREDFVQGIIAVLGGWY
jgi:ankyrin repeat protein